MQNADVATHQNPRRTPWNKGNLAIDSKLRGCDVVSLKVEDVAPHGLKTGHPVRFELTEQTREAIDDYITATGKKPGDLLFASRRKRERCMTTVRLDFTCLVKIAAGPKELPQPQ